MQFLYLDGDAYVFMDNVDYEQLTTPKASLGSSAQYLKEGDSAVLQMYEDEIVRVDLPAAVELTVKRDRAGSYRATSPGLWRPQAVPPWRPAFRSRCHVFVNGGPDQGRHPQRRVPDSRLRPFSYVPGSASRSA